MLALENLLASSEVSGAASLLSTGLASRGPIKEGVQQLICKNIFFGEVEFVSYYAIYLMLMLRTCRCKEVA